MKKNEAYRCSNCGYETIGFFGKCPNCGEWGTLEEKKESENLKKTVSGDKFSEKLEEIDSSKFDRIKSDIEEFDRVMGGGIIRDSVTILTAKPGAGKSTLLLQLSEKLSDKDYKILYISGEESAPQIKNRADRLKISSKNINVLSTNSIQVAEGEIFRLDPDILVFDSIQTIKNEELSQRSGSPTQIMEVADKIVNLSKSSNKKRASFIVGQMTKQDELAGVRSLEHLVDCVLVLEVPESDQIRLLRSTKNRFGDTGEVGFFEMTEEGLNSIDNPSEYFVTENDGSYGKSLTILRNGSRFVTVEIESLVSKSFFPYPQRISEDINRDKFSVIASIITETANINLDDKNIILKSTGGLRIDDVACDLSIATSILSAYFKKPLSQDTIFLGELGLTGNIKKVQNIKQRLNEIQYLGYKNVVISSSQNAGEKYNLNIIKLKNIKDIISLFFN